MAMPIIKDILSRILSLEKKDSDTWHEATLNSEVSKPSGAYGGYSGIIYKKIGDHVYIQGSVSCTWNGSDAILLTTLPSGYRPSGPTYILSPLSGSNIARLVVGENGKLYIEWVRKISDGSAVTSNMNWIQINIDYLI